MNDLPYNTLKQNTRAYEIMLLRDQHESTFTSIAKKLHITPAKARHTYENFYHKQTVALIRDLKEKSKFNERELDIFEYYFTNYKSSKKRYDALMENLNL